LAKRGKACYLTVVSRYYPLLASLSPLLRYRGEVDRTLLAPEVAKLRKQILRSKHWDVLRRNLSSPDLAGLAATSCDLLGDEITAQLPQESNEELLSTLSKLLIPWRIGPYRLGQLFIDSEWRSHIKWRHIAPLLRSTEGIRIADVGASNGYFLFKLAANTPEVALGFDPIDRCWLQFALLQSILRVPNVGFVPAGLSSLAAFPHFFDLILCMGVMYHQRDHLAATRCLFNATRPGGQVVIESLVIDRHGTTPLIPAERYAKMRNAWVIPTVDSLAWCMKEAGFRSISLYRFGPVTPAEQRRTEWAPYESLADFLDPNDPTKTVEGYPAPHSAAVIGYR
jgi:tRNA (mo5U34)-methyltransferase